MIELNCTSKEVFILFRKLTSVFLIIIIITSFVACNSDDETKHKTGWQNPAEPTTSSEEAASDTETTTEKTDTEVAATNEQEISFSEKKALTIGSFTSEIYGKLTVYFQDSYFLLFDEYKANGIKVVYLTPNMYNTYVSPNTPDYLVQMAYDCADCENSGEFAKHVERGKEIAKEYGFYVADVYSEWKKLQSYGINTTALLANQINHPTRKMHKLYADVIFKCLIDNNLI